MSLKPFLVLGIIILSSFCAIAQSGEDLKELFPTKRTSLKKKGRQKGDRRKKDSGMVIYTTNAYGVLYGSPCALHATRKMGFEYIVEPPKMGYSKSRVGRIINNLWVKTKLVFTRSPFWKLILNKRIKKCRELMGDKVG